MKKLSPEEHRAMGDALLLKKHEALLERRERKCRRMLAVRDQRLGAGLCILCGVRAHELGVQRCRPCADRVKANAKGEAVFKIEDPDAAL